MRLVGSATACLVRVINSSSAFPSPWTVEALDGGYKLVDANGQSLAYVYGHLDRRDAETAKGLTVDEARRISSNIAKLPTLLGWGLIQIHRHMMAASAKS